MKTPLILTTFVATTLLLGGCGVAETAAVAATEAEAAAENAKQAKETQAKIEKQLEEVQQASADARAELDKE
jgi:hypothetical protein